jgi:hypothetical protein
MSKEKKAKPERKIHKDFTMEEFDVFTMDLQCEGAAHERRAIIEELQRRARQVNELSDLAPAGKLDSSVEWAILSYGLEMAVKIIYKMPQFESRCGCTECGAI